MRGISCDVAVVGAGMAGIAAAVTSARKGKKTILIEQNDFLGGEVISGMHLYLCGLYTGSGQILNHGISQELVDFLIKRKCEMVRIGKVYCLRFETRDLAAALKKIIKNKDLKVMLNTSFISARASKGLIISLQAKKNGKNLNILPRAVVDCSGTVIKKVRGAFLRDKEVKHLGGYCFKVSANCRDPLLGVRIAYSLRQAVEAKKLPWYFRLTQTTIANKQAALIKMSMPFDSMHIKNAKRDCQKLFAYLRKNIPELKTAKIITYGTLLERSGVRLLAKKTLTQDDVILGRQYLFDVAAKGAWPVEFWGEKGVEYAYCQKSHYDIPNDCLRAKNIKNLFAAGRFIGADIKAIASARVAGACFATGEAAGRLSARVV